MIVIIDYGMGNLRSVHNKLKRLGCYSEISSDKSVIEKAEKLILPGVGHFANGMKKLHEFNLLGILNKKVMEDQVPILGICLGMQLMTSFSEEGNVNGLNWFEAQTQYFKIEEKDKFKYKVPHMGWNNVRLSGDSKLFKGIDEDAEFYFVHSYHVVKNKEGVTKGITNYAYDFISYVEKRNIFGAQFHPEKSQDAGMIMFSNFNKL